VRVLLESQVVLLLHSQMFVLGLLYN